MALAQDAEAVSGELSGAGGADSEEPGRTERPGNGGSREEGGDTPAGDGAMNESQSGVPTISPPQSVPPETTSEDRVTTTRPPQCPAAEAGGMEPTKDVRDPSADAARTSKGDDATKPTAGEAATDVTTPSAGKAATDVTTPSAGEAATDATKPTAGEVATKPTAGDKTMDTTKTPLVKPPTEPTKSALDKELEALLSFGLVDPPPHDVLMIQSEPNGTMDIVKADPSLEDPSVTEGKGPPPPLRPATTWTSANLREFKHRMASEKHGLLTIRRGEVVTVRVPTHPEGKRLCWEFATDDYDIGFGIYFDWTPVTSTAVTLQVSESSDDEEEEETESPWHSREGDVERGSVYRLRSRYGEIMQVFRRDSHREVQAGSHDYPGEGIYLLKLDNSYSLLRSKTLYFHVYYSS